MDQFVIKGTLIIAFVAFTFVLVRASSSARSQAIRAIALGFFLVVVVLAVSFPGLVDGLAQLVGVGRGADLLLYAFIIVFIGQLLSARRRNRAQDEQITELARTLALMRVDQPNSEPPKK